MIRLNWQEPPAARSTASKIRRVLSDQVVRELKVNPMRYALLFTEVRESTANQVRRICRQYGLEVTARRLPSDESAQRLQNIYVRYNPRTDKAASDER